METLLPSILFGILGGLVRFWYLALTLFVAALVGGVTGAIADGDWRLANISPNTYFILSLRLFKKIKISRLPT